MPILRDHDGYFSTKTEKSVLTNLVTIWYINQEITLNMMNIDIICVLFHGLTLFIPGESCFKGFWH